MNHPYTQRLPQRHHARQWLAVASLAAQIFLSPTSAQPEAETAIDLDAILEDVRQNDPSIQAAKLRWESLKETAPAAKGLPDPNLTLGYFASSVETRVGPMEGKLNLSQKLPYPGKLKLAESQALAEAEVASWQYLRIMRERSGQAKRHVAELYRIDATRALVEEQLALVDERIETLSRRYEGGQAELPEILLAKQRLSELKTRLLSLDGQREAAIAQLDRLRGRANARSYATLDKIPEPNLIDSNRLFALAEQNSEWLQAENAAITMAESGLKLAKRNRMPDFTLGVDYTTVGRNVFSSPSDNGQDAVMAYLSVNLPIWKGKYDAREEGARMRLEAQRVQRSATLQDLQAAIGQQHARAEAFRDQIVLYREDLLPQAEARHEATLASYAAGQTTALHWIESQRDLLKAQSGLVLLQSEYYAAIAELETIAAVDLKTL